MVQIIRENRKPSFSERLNEGVGRGLEFGSQIMEKHKNEQMMKKRADQIQQLTGYDVSGLSEDQQKAFLSEIMKQQGKNQRLGQTQDFLGQIFNKPNNQQQNQQINQFDQNQINPDEQQQNSQGFDPSQLSDSDIAQATAMDPNLGRILQQQKDSSLRRSEEQKKLGFEREKLERHEASEITKPLLLELNQSRKNIPLQEQAIEDIQNASPDVGAQDYIADVLGFEPMRTAKGAQLKTAIKDFFLSDLTRVGARPNQWIEQQLADALPKVGRDPEANLITAEGMKFKVDLAKKRIEILDQLASDDEKKYGFVKKDIDSRASQLMKPYVEQRKKELEQNIKSIKRTYEANKTVPKGYVRMKNPETGEVYDILKGHAKEAIKAGWEKQ